MASAIGGLPSPAGDAIVDVRHEARDRLMVHRDGLDVARALEQRVEQADVAVPILGIFGAAMVAKSPQARAATPKIIAAAPNLQPNCLRKSAPRPVR